MQSLSKSEEKLRSQGLTDIDIARMKAGQVPKGYQVHHNHPLDDSGTNDFENLVLIKNEPYHKLVTNYQKEVTRGLDINETRTVPWPEIKDQVFTGGSR